MTKEYELQLKAWKTGESYTEGLRLWKQRYGEDIAYKMLCMGPNDFNREKMRAGLEKPFPVPDPIPAAVKKPGKVAVLENTVGEIGESVDSLESDLRDVEDAVDDLGESVKDVIGNIENIEGSVQDLHDKVEKFLADRPAAVQVKATTAEARRQNAENEPTEVREWHRLTYGLMDERVLLKQRLRDLPDPERREARKEAAYRILDITAELDILFGKIGYWEQHGRVPSNVPIEEQGILYPKRYLNLRSYVSRTRKKMEEAQDPGIKAGLAEKIKDYEREMKEIEIDL